MEETSGVPINTERNTKMLSEHADPEHHSAADSKIGSVRTSRESSPSVNSPSASEKPRETSLPPVLTLDAVNQMQMQQLQVFQNVLQLQQAHHNKEIQQLKWQLDTQALITSQAFSALEVSTSQANEFLRQLNTRAKDHQFPEHGETKVQSASSNKSGITTSTSDASDPTYPPQGAPAVPAEPRLPQLPSITLPDPFSAPKSIEAQRSPSIHAPAIPPISMSATTQAPYVNTPSYSDPQQSAYMPHINPKPQNYQLSNGSLHEPQQYSYSSVSVPVSMPVRGQAGSPSGLPSMQPAGQLSRQSPEQTMLSNSSIITSPNTASSSDVLSPFSGTDTSSRLALPPITYPDSSGRSQSVPQMPTSPRTEIPVTELRSHSYQLPSRNLSNTFYSKENHMRGKQAKVPILGVKESRYQTMLKRKRKMTKTWKIVNPSNSTTPASEAPRPANDGHPIEFPTQAQFLNLHQRNRSQSHLLPRLEALMLPHYTPIPQPQGPKDTDYESFYNIPRPRCLDPLPPPIQNDAEDRQDKNEQNNNNPNAIQHGTNPGESSKPDDSQKNNKLDLPFLGNSPRCAHDHLVAVVGLLLFSPVHVGSF